MPARAQFTSVASFFMSARSFLPTKPFVSAFCGMCSVMKSDSRKIVSTSAGSMPNSLAFSGGTSGS